MLPNSGYYQNSPSNISDLNRSHQQLSHSSPNNLRLKSNQNINLQPLSQKNSGNESNSCEITPKFNGNSASCQNSPSGQQVSHNSSLRDASPNNSRGSENSGYYQNSPSNLPNPNRLQDISQLNAIHDRDASPNDPRNGSKIIQNIDLQSYKQNSSRNESNRSEMLPKFIENPRYYQNSSSDIRSQQSQRISPLVGVQSTNSSPISLQNLHISEQQILSTSKDLNKNNQRLSQPSPSRISPAIISYSSNSSPVNYPRISSVSPQTVPINSSPQKLLNLQNVEAFYWKKISEMKEKEQMNHMYFQPQTQMTQFGNNISDARQSRSRDNTPHSVIPQNRGRRSLSLPRNIRPEKPNNMHTSFEEPTRLYSNNSEGNTSGYGYTTVQQGPSINQLSNFNRRTPQRSTISAIKYNNPGDAIYENYVPGVQFRHQALSVNKSCEQTYAPIFKRGSLQKNSQEDMNIGNAGQKKVSFLSATQSSVQPNQQSSPPAWPTKNGYVQSPPTRRNNRSESVGSDNVFISETPTKVPSTCDRTQLFFPNNQDYGRTHQQIMLAPMYGQDIYGQAIYGKTVQVPQNIYGNGTNQNAIYGKTSSAVYGKTAQPKQVIVRNKVCDMYGQIHDTTDDSNQIYGQIKKSGIIYGELKGPSNCQTMNPLQQRALPSPPQKQSQSMIVPRSSTYVYSNAQMNQLPQQIQSESESGSEAGEVQRIMKNMDAKNQPIPEEEWNADGKSGRGHSGNESGGVVSDGELRGSRSGRSARRDDPRRHTLSGDQHLYQPGGTPGGILRTMDLESSLPRGYPPPNAMLFDDDPGIMSEVETSSTGFRRGGKQRSSLPVVRTPSKTLERPLGLVFLQYRNETKRALLPNEITSIDTVKALFVRSFPKQLTMEYLDSPLVKIYIHDSSKDMFYELEDLSDPSRSHLRDIRDRSVLRLFESTDISGGLPVAGQGISGGVGHFEDQSYFSEPEFDSEYQHQHIHKSKSSAKAAPPYYLASTTSTLPRGGPLLRTYSPAIGGAPPIPADRIKSLPGQTDRMRTDGYMSSPERSTRGQYEDPYYSQFAPRSGSITPVIDEEASDTELLDESYSLYGAKIPSGGPRAVPAPRSQFPTPAAVPYDTTRIRVEHMERQLANLTGLVQKALTQAPTAPRDFLIPPGRDSFRSDDSYLRSDTKTPKLGKSGCHKSVSFEKSVSFSDEPPDMNSPKQHSPQHTADTKPPKPAIKSSTLPRTSSQERDRLKPAPPPKPAALAVQYDSSRHLYRDLQLTPEMYNQLRGLQKKAKDLRAEVRNLRRMSQAQAHSVRETIRDTFIKIRTMLLVGGEQAWQAGMDQERVRLSREEDLYKQEMIRLEKDLSDLESTVEELRGNVINRKTRVNMSDVENMALILSKSSKTVADLKVRFPSLQEGLKGMLTSEMEKVVREEKFLKEEPERLESALRRCKKLTGTLVTLKRLASVQEQRLPCPGNPTGDGRLSPSTDETPPVTPTSAQHGKPNSNIPTSRPNVGPGGIGGDSIDSESSQRPENALDALLDELQTFSRPHNSAPPPSHALPQQQSTTHAPSMGEIGRKGSMDSHALTVSTGSGTGSLRRLHSYPSGSDTDNSPPIQPAPRAANIGVKPPLPERNAELLQALAGRRVPPPPPPRTSSRSPLASPTSPGIPPRNNTPSTLQHIQNVQNMAQNENTTQSQFDAARENLGLGGTLRRNVPGRSSLKERSQTLPRNIGSNLQVHTQQQQTEIDNNMMMLTASNSSSCESVNSQEGAKKNNRQEQLEMRHQELLKKQKALQEQYARLQQLQRGNNALTVVPPTPDILLKKTGSESNILQKMGLNMMTASPQINTGSLTHLANNNGNLSTVPVSNENSTQQSTGASTTSKVYETDIL
ncbi:coiled-coil domain-containing protein AGAP005037 isoform X4 [Chrysoperla carnea]|uniref:coiled-coil domain-containing protein AGAP005037 isoform X4 n=1 Tax=Chrysoperla carnea TaxID=189513 RepID=UPI001D098F9B|nr:coiled-coil domain-containing protein AGAP005037 isoform X4 [Chrysoperla carnea]